MKRQQTFNIKGMTKDISRSKSGSSLAYDIQNMRLTFSRRRDTIIPSLMRKEIKNIF